MSPLATRKGRERRALLEFISFLLILCLTACGAQPTLVPVTITNPADSASVVRFEPSDNALRDKLQFSAKPMNELRDASGRSVLAAFEFSARDSKGITISRFDKPVHVTIQYGSMPLGGVQESELTLVYFNPATRTWDDVSSRVDTSTKSISADLDHFSGYGVTAKAPKPTPGGQVAGALTVTSAPNGKATIAVLVGTGALASAVKERRR